MPLSPSKRARVEQDVQAAPTEDLLERVTVCGAELEQEALALIEAELRRRGCHEAEIRDHAAATTDVLRCSDGTAVRYSFAHGRLFGPGGRGASSGDSCRRFRGSSTTAASTRGIRSAEPDTKNCLTFSKP